MFTFWASELALLAWSRAISSSLMSPSSFFLILRASAFARCSDSRLACIESIARTWFLLKTKDFKSKRKQNVEKSLDKPSILKLLLLLSKPSINLLPHLTKLQLGPQNLKQ